MENESLRKLAEQAKEVLELKHSLGQRRPLVIEICGTPKSGKTTSIQALNLFLKRNEFETAVVHEMAAVCPIRNKTDFYFNSWTLFTSLSETLKQLEIKNDKADIIIIDRSIFDSLCWFRWLNCNPDSNPYIDNAQHKAFANFLTSTPMWTSLFDITYILKSVPSVSMKREFAHLLTNKSGSIMNDAVLSSFNDAIDETKEHYGKRFKKILELDTSNVDPAVVGLQITQNVLRVLKELLTERIGYFFRITMENTISEGINDFRAILPTPMYFDSRKRVESSDEIQPIAIAVITNKKRDKVLVLKKNDTRTEKGSPEHKRLLLYLGGHVRDEDLSDEPSDNFETLKNAIRREIKEEINEKLSLGDQVPFVIYTPINPKSRRHIAICFVIEMDLDNKSFKPTTEEFITKSGATRSGQVVSLDELLHSEEKFEPWSEYILKHVFDVKNISSQKSLFEL